MKEAYPPIMTTEEAAEYLQLHPLTVRRLAREGEIPALKVGRLWRVKKALLDRWITERSIENVAKETASHNQE